MLTYYLALGLLGASAPVVPATPLVTPPDRTIKLTRDGGPFTAVQQIDPSDVVEFVISANGLLADGEGVASVHVALKPAAIAAGFQIRDAAPYAPVAIDTANLRVWASVLDANRADAGWATAKPCAFDIDVDTDSSPPRHYQRTGQITVVQK